MKKMGYDIVYIHGAKVCIKKGSPRMSRLPLIQSHQKPTFKIVSAISLHGVPFFVHKVIRSIFEIWSFQIVTVLMGPDLWC